MGNLSKRAFQLLIAVMLCGLPWVSGFAASGEDSVELRVVKGDTLIHLCRKYMEHPAKWREVAKFNRMKNPDYILPGQRVGFPVSLMPRVPVDGHVTFVHGDATMQKREGAEWTALHAGDPVSQGSRLKTGKASSVEVTFGDRNSIFIKPDTTLGVATSEKRGPSYGVTNVYLAIGRAIARLKEATGGDSRMQIRTPSAIASVRGTEFRVSADEKESMRTEVLTGTVNVIAGERTVQLKKGEGTYVEKGAAPVSARKLLSAPKLAGHKPLYKELPLKFVFEDMEGLSSVRGLLARDVGGRDIVDEKVVKQKEPMEFVNVRDGVYYLFVQGADELGIEGFESEPYEIKLHANPLPPLLELKGDEAEFIGKSARFTWLKVKDAAMYHVQVADDNGFTLIKEEKADHKGESYTTGPFDYGTYYFRISSIAGDGYEAGWSQTLPFRLIEPPLIEKPAIGEKEVFLKWRGLGEGITYRFQMAKDEGFREILVDRRIDKAEIALEKPKESGVYHVRTSTIDRIGREGDFSAPQSFEVEQGFPFGVLAGVAGAIGLILLIAP